MNTHRVSPHTSPELKATKASSHSELGVPRRSLHDHVSIRPPVRDRSPRGIASRTARAAGTVRQVLGPGRPRCSFRAKMGRHEEAVRHRHLDAGVTKITESFRRWRYTACEKHRSCEMAICSACFGSGQQTCPMCNGKGTGPVRFDRNGIMEVPPCGGCGGRRHIRCSGCSGTGQGVSEEARGIVPGAVVSPLPVQQNRKASAFIIVAALFVCFVGIPLLFFLQVLVLFLL